MSLFLRCMLFVSQPNLPGQAVRILDGDTIEVLHDGKAERTCLDGIDCPEKGKPTASERL